jgi:hypothetical protein
MHAYNILVGEIIGKPSLGKPNMKWEDNINIHLRVIICEKVRWLELVEDDVEKGALLLMVLKIRILFT